MGSAASAASPRVCLITGPTSGLGRGLALELAARGYQLALLGRNAGKLARLAAECSARGAPAPVQIVCDLACQAEVRRAAAEFLAADLPLHVLINNAGVINRERRITPDGLEETMAVGYYSMFLLTLLLVERMQASAPATIINTTSDTYPFGRIPFADPDFEKRYGPLRSYAASKLATVYFTRLLAERLAGHGVGANAYNPGMIYTGLAVGNNRGPLVRVADFFWKRIAGPVSAGIGVPLRLATAEDLAATTGQIYMRGEPVACKPVARDPLVGAALWELGETLTGARWPLPAGRAAGTSVAPIRLGVLGAAKIAPFAVFKHIPEVAGIELAAVAEEYQPFGNLVAYARKYGIPRVYRSFDKLLRDPGIDAVYVPLPISLHARWTLAAIAAGKHVLCEKPLAANAREAEEIDAAARRSGLIVAEAMHSRHHPLAARVREIIGSGEIGELRYVRASFSAWLPFDNFRMHYALGGGGMIDMGCYPVAFLRAVLDAEPAVAAAQAELCAPAVDGAMKARLDFPGGIVADLFVAMRSLRPPLSVSMRFTGTRGRIDLLNFIKPEVYHRLSVRTEAGRRVERVPGGSTYRAQLAAFVEAIRSGKPPPTSTADALATLRVIDAVYEKAGLPVRGLPDAP